MGTPSGFFVIGKVTVAHSVLILFRNEMQNCAKIARKALELKELYFARTYLHANLGRYLEISYLESNIAPNT